MKKTKTEVMEASAFAQASAGQALQHDSGQAGLGLYIAKEIVQANNGETPHQSPEAELIRYGVNAARCGAGPGGIGRSREGKQVFCEDREGISTIFDLMLRTC